MSAACAAAVCVKVYADGDHGDHGDLVAILLSRMLRIGSTWVCVSGQPAMMAVMRSARVRNERRASGYPRRRDIGRWLVRGYALATFFHALTLLRNRSPRVIPTLRPVTPPPSLPHLPAKDAPLVTFAQAPLVSIILPARDEAENIEGCVAALLPQSAHGRPVEICAVDDASQDATGALLDTLAQRAPGRIRVRHLQELPPGWTGKPHAMHAATQLAEGEWLLFTDADTRWQSGAVEALVSYAETRHVDLLTVMPRQVLPSLIERIVGPALVQTLFQTASPVAVNSPKRRSVALANGQCILLRRSVYTAVGGYARPELRAVILDDTSLARVVKRAGYRLQMAAGHELLTVRMYPSGPAAWHGWRRNIGASFREYSRPLATLSFALFIFLSALPYGLTLFGLLELLAGTRGKHGRLPGGNRSERRGSTLLRERRLNEPLLTGAFSLGVTLSGFAWAVRTLELPLGYTFCHPISQVLELALMGQAWWRRIRGAPITWRGRAYSATSAGPTSSSPASSLALSSSAAATADQSSGASET